MASEVAPPDLATVQATFGLDERCVKGLAELPPADQLIVIDVVSNKQCNNASAFTWATVRKMRESPGQLKLEYLRRHLDERAQEGLSKLPLVAQELVASQVDVLRVRNLSAFAWKQIRAMQQSGAGIVGPVVGARGPVLQAQLAAANARDRSRSPAMPGGLSAQIAHLRAGLAANGSMSGPGPGLAGGPDPEVSAFMMSAGLDSGALQALTSLDPSGQRMVAALVQKQPARNPSAVTWSMVKLVREKPLEAKMEFFRIALDSEATAALERLPPEEQEVVLSQVDVAQCRNLSAFVWSRVKSLTGPPLPGPSSAPGIAPLGLQAGFHMQPRHPQQGMPMMGANGGQVSMDEHPDPAAVAGVILDARCLQKLRDLPVSEQMAILQSVPADCRNPSAFVWSKVKVKV